MTQIKLNNINLSQTNTTASDYFGPTKGFTVKGATAVDRLNVHLFSKGGVNGGTERTMHC